ncbi:hypothetical protein PPYR_06943 [Photinus pyralis]|uniref:Cadherin domain-containing protein n=4 Tax=Photinus pyralis TaxID=7054 RepID=A0A5N4AP50_PHOPY|nr:cadherin-23-like [Photinus pyralis]XP_031340757.1 cadherin-23-like [Photinus pyralis]KAB0799063.1 hypothetical protein PPYR_06943 [Photinus pyralis]
MMSTGRRNLIDGHRSFFRIKVRLKFSSVFLFFKIVCVLYAFQGCISGVLCNRPPRFLIDGQTEIVIRLKEGSDTPVGSVIYKLHAIDPDGDNLKFGVKQQSGSEVIRVETTSANEANVYLNQELDREVRDEYAIVLTLTDGRLGSGNYVTQSLLLLVEDVNDNVPIFKPYQSTIILPEDSSPDVIATLQATDADEGAYGQVVYHMQGSQSLFSISTVSGSAVLRLIGSLDYEKQSLHQLKVLAIDRAKQGRVNTGTAALVVKVQDVDDQPPEFVRVQSVARVSEDAPIGTSVLQVKAVDGDRGINNIISYALTSNDISPALAELFAIEEHTGVVYTKSKLDREALTSNSGAYILQIMAVEQNSRLDPQPSAVTEVTVMITDVNDEKPQFRNSHYECEVSENVPNNTPLLFSPNFTPEVYDRDQGNNGTFILSIEGANNIFEVMPRKIINEATFTIRVRNSSHLDFEQLTIINFTLVAKEVVADDPHMAKVPVTVFIRDQNDNYPEFTQELYEISIPENSEAGTTVAWVQALDDDSENYGTRGIRYTNLAGSIQHMLHLHPVSGVITIKEAGGPNWDREQVSRHYLTAEARDDLGKGNRNSVQLIINLEDENDNPPLFSRGYYEARISENEDDFEHPLRIEARDSDLNGTKNSEIEYVLFGDFKHNFSINTVTGLIKPKRAFDFEELTGSADEHVRPLHLTIRAKDCGTPSLASDVPLIIYVHDINDHKPYFEYSFYNTTIPETASGGTHVLQVHAIDWDGSTPNNKVIYRIQGGAFDKFIIDSESGVISVAPGASLDPDLNHPRRMLYSLLVAALDSAPGDAQLYSTVTVNITISDVNNKPPTLSIPSTLKLREDIQVGSIVTKLEGQDLDTSASLRYTLDPLRCEAKTEYGVSLSAAEYNCLSIFKVGQFDGSLVIAKPLDREVAEQFYLGVLVEDIASETDLQQTKASLTIEVLDVNDNNPKFRKSHYRFTVTENSKNGVVVGNVIADDLDKNKSITYSLEGSAQLLEFLHLDSNSGELVVANKIDHEAYQWLNLTVKAVDSGLPRRSSRVELYVQVLDENDNNPYFLPEPKELIVTESISIGETIGTVQAHDLDSGDFAKITYLLDRVSSQGKFSINPETGEIKVADFLDRETKSSYFLILEAWDNYQYGYYNSESRNAFKHVNVTISDVNDNTPKLHLPSSCVSVTEFHEPLQPITTIQASDDDDPSTVNGQVMLDISDGNLYDTFELQQIDRWSAHLHSLKPLKGQHGNYTITIRAQDLGHPSLSAEAPLQLCITDYNDHAPFFVTPPHNSTLKVPENATVGSALIKIVAIDDDVGGNGAVRYRLKTDPAGHWKAFNLQPVSGILELRLPLNRKKQKIYDIRIEAYDLGEPSLSSDLDLTIYISNIDDYRPQFTTDDFFLNFTENEQTGVESYKLPDTIDRDELEFEGPFAPICYHIVGGNEEGLFNLHATSHELTVNTPLDRERRDTHVLLVQATEDCASPPTNLTLFDPHDDTLLKVSVKVLDINDNAPVFRHRIFTGGVSTATDFGTDFMTIIADDLDEGINSELSYYLIGKIRMTLTEGLENLGTHPFLVDRLTGNVQLNFDPQQGMKGYFDFMVLVNDTGGLEDRAHAFIYLLREDQRVRFVLRQHAAEIRNHMEAFREVLGNVTGAFVNVDELKVHTNHDGTVDKTRTDVYLHLVNRRDNSILEVDEVLRLIDQNTEKLDYLFKEFNVLDTQPGGSYALISTRNPTESVFWLTAMSLFLLLLLLLCLALCINQRHTYQRKLKAATATAYGGDSEIDDRGVSALSGRVPNTNKHSMEGSNPIWLQAYENEWYKSDELSCQGTDRDSLDENVVSGSGDSTCCINNAHDQIINCIQNVYQTLPPIPPPRKLETTEL